MKSCFAVKGKKFYEFHLQVRLKEAADAAMKTETAAAAAGDEFLENNDDISEDTTENKSDINITEHNESSLIIQ